mmetsp:Transcript_2200/g.6628  ORF Transcript_2200/g.6628 Transcript_2200/m.6628 type:complete len:315 (-) Transcript_2200:253-1197(-)
MAPQQMWWCVQLASVLALAGTARGAHAPLARGLAPRTVRLRLSAIRASDPPPPSRTLADSLREETEAPFRKPRLFLYVAAAGSAGIGGAVTLANLVGALASGVRLEDLAEPLRNLAIDAVGLVGAGALIKGDLDSQQKRMARLEAGRRLARLRVRLQRPSDTSTVSMSDLRSGRGRDSRVVIVLGARDVIEASLATAEPLSSSLRERDLLVVPAALDGGRRLAAEPPAHAQGLPHVALPTGAGEWAEYIAEVEGARLEAQGIDLKTQAVAVVLKKNGRVGQRALVDEAQGGVPWGALIGDVDRRSNAGMDVTNI